MYFETAGHNLSFIYPDKSLPDPRCSENNSPLADQCQVTPILPYHGYLYRHMPQGNVQHPNNIFVVKYIEL